MQIAKNIKKFVWFGALPLAIFFVVLVVPFSQGIFLTFTDWNGFDYKDFVGFDNYVKSFSDDTFWSTLGSRCYLAVHLQQRTAFALIHL